ncbi:MAG: hypothetical protein Q7T62_02915 [Undibacterium sp.]|nr:hypothetical protein [Undibacterium sp.]
MRRYAERGERTAYWEYLADKGDPYAKLAVQVVLNNTFGGFAANGYASLVADSLGQHKTAEEWDLIGQALVKDDIGRRADLVADGKEDLALYLPVDAIKNSHLDTFAKYKLPLDAWTAWNQRGQPRILFQSVKTKPCHAVHALS